MKLGKILKSFVICVFLGTIFGLIGFFLGAGCTQQCTEFEFALSGSEGVNPIGDTAIINGIYCLIVGGILGVVLGIFKSFKSNKGNEISDYADYTVSRKELEKSVSEMKRRIDGTVTQYNNMFDGESYYCQKEKTSIEEVMKQYKEKLGELDAAVQKFNETNMEDKGHGNV